MVEYPHRTPSKPVVSSLQSHGQVLPRVPSLSACQRHPSSALDSHLMRRNNNTYILENIVPDPRLSPEIDVVCPREYSCLKGRQLSRNGMMLLYCKSNGRDTEPDELVDGV